MATGIIPFAYLPPELSGLPSDQLSHSSAHSDLGRFSGKKVLVVGGGSSALETAALLLEQGTSVKMIARDNSVSWPIPNPASPTRLQQLRRPVVRLCEGWTCWAYDRLPEYSGICRRTSRREEFRLPGPRRRLVATRASGRRIRCSSATISLEARPPVTASSSV